MITSDKILLKILCLFAFTTPAFAGNGVPAVLPFQGRVTDDTGSPINYPVTIKFRIYPPAGNCYLYEESQNITPNAYGIFSALLGAGISTGPNNTLDKVFNNDPTAPVTNSCSSTYTPAMNDWRRLELVINGTPLAGMQTIGASAFALNSQMLEGKTSLDFIQKNGTVTQANITTLTNGTDASSLHNHDALYAKISGNNSFSGNLSTSGNIYATGVTGSLGVGTSSTAADIHVKKDSPSIRLESNLGTSGSSRLDFFGGSTQRGRIEAAESTNGLKLYSGTTLAVTVDSIGNLILAGSMKTAGTLGLGQYTTAQETSLLTSLSALGVTAKGTIWVNSTAATIRYWDGSAAQTLWTQSNSGVTAGTYGSAVSVPILTIDLYGRITSATTAALSIAPNQIAQGGATSGQVLKWNGSAWLPAADQGISSESDPTVLAWAKAAPSARLSTTGNILDLAASGVSANTYGSSTQIPVFTVDAYGRITTVTNTTISGASPAGASLTSAQIWVGNASNQATATALSGDVTLSNSGVASVQKIKGQTLSGNAPSAGSLLVYNGTFAYWEAQTLPSCSASETLTFNSISGNFSCVTIANAANFTGNLSGDVTGSQGSTVLAKIQTKPISMTALTTRDVLQYNGTGWVNKNIPACGANQYLTFDGSSYSCVTDVGSGSLVSSVSANSPLSVNTSTGAITVSLNYDNTTLSLNGSQQIQVKDGSITSAKLGGGTNGDVFYKSAGAWTSGTADSAGIVDKSSAQTISGNKTFSGSLVHSSSGATQIAVGSTAQQPGTPSLGMIRVNTSIGNKLEYWDGSTWIMPGTSTSFSGDVSGAFNSTSVDKIKGTAVSVSSLSSGNLLKYNGSAWVNSNLSTSDVPNLDASKITSGTLPVSLGGTGSGAALTNNKVMVSSGGAIVEGNGFGSTKAANTFVTRDASGNFAAGAGTLDSLVLKGVTSGTVTLTAPSVVTSYSLSWPVAAGSSGQFLMTDGSGNLTWGAPSGSPDASYSTKGIFQADTDAATSGLSFSSSGVLKVNAGTGANQIVKLDSSSKLPAVDGSALTNLNANNIASGTLPISRGGTGQTTKTAAFDALSPNSTKGDITVFNGTNNVSLPLGSNGQVLTADSTQATGVKWASAASGTVTSVTAGMGLNGGTITSVGTLSVNVGTGANQIVQLDASSKLPAVDGSQLTNLSFSQISSGTLSIAKGGTGASSFSANQLVGTNGTGTALQSVTCTQNQIISFDASGNYGCYNLSSIASGTYFSNGGNTFGANATLGTNDNFSLALKTNNSNRLMIDSSGKVGVGTVSPSVKLEINGTVKVADGGESCSVGADGGMIRYNGGNLQFCNGSSWQTLGISGAGLTNLNGLTSSSQNFTTASTGTDFTITSSGTLHTFAIPSASATARGLLTSSDWTTFNNKLGTSTTFSGDVSGAYNSTSVDKIKGTAVSVSSLSSGNLLKYNGSAWVNSNLSTSDVPNLDASKITSGTLPVSLGGTGSGTALTNNKVMVSSGGAIVEGNGFGSTKAANTFVTRDASGNFAAGTGTFDSVILKGGTSGTLTWAVPATVTSHTLTWPAALGSAGQVLSTDASGNLSWMTPSSTGVTNINGSTASSQTFSTPGVSGTAPNWSTNTGSGTHTLNIPMASAASVTAGLISKTDYDAFNNKLGTATSFSGDISGNYNTVSVDKIKGGTLSISSLSSGNFLKYNGSAWINSNIAVADVPNLDASKITSGVLSVVNGGTGLNAYSPNALIMANGTGSGLISMTCNLNEVLKWSGTAWVCGTAGSSPGDAGYGSGNKGVVAFDTDAATSGISVTAGIATVNFGTGANQIVKLDASAKLPSVNGSALTNLNAGNISSGTLTVANGGTGLSSYAAGDLIYASGATVVSKLAIGTTGTILTSNGTSPTWSSLTSAGIFVNNGNSFGASAVLGTNDANSLALKTNNTARMTFDTSGNIGIGTSSPSNALSFSGQAARTIGMERNSTSGAVGNSLTIAAGGANNSGANSSAGGDLILSSGISVGTGSSKIQFKTYDGTSGVAGVDNAASISLTILGNGNIGIGTANTNPSYALDANGATVRITNLLSTSDRRLKTNIRPIEGLEIVRKINGVRFDWVQNQKPDFGLIAQEVEAALPEAVSTDQEGYKAVKYQNMVAPLIESVKEIDVRCEMTDSQIRYLKAQNQELENRVRHLEERNLNLEKRLSAMEAALGGKQ